MSAAILPASQIGESKLRRVLKAAATETGLRQPDLCPLTAQSDPFLQDTATNHLISAWFAGAVAEFRPDGRFHLRGLHYRLMSVPGGYQMPGRRAVGLRSIALPSMGYENTPECFAFLKLAAKAARWLQYVDWDRFVDERNAAPEIFVPDAGRIEAGVTFGGYVSVPSLNDSMPSLYSDGFAGRQPYRLIIIGEKSSLAPEVRPIAEAHGAEMMLFTGTASLTLIAGSVRRAANDGRPAVVFYLSDFDPAGALMATHVARAIQAHCVSSYPDLDIKLYPVALTCQQCIDSELPSTPLSEGERRKDRWEALYGREQTEIDALLALKPGRLGEILTAAIAPFYDSTLAARARRAERAWLRTANEILQHHPAYADIRKDIGAAVDALEEAAAGLEAAQDRARELMKSIALPRAEQVAWELPEETPPVPLFDSSWDYAKASRKLVIRNKLLGDDIEFQLRRKPGRQAKPKHINGRGGT